MVRLLVILCEGLDLNRTYLKLDILYKVYDSCMARELTVNGCMGKWCLKQ